MSIHCDGCENDRNECEQCPHGGAAPVIDWDEVEFEDADPDLCDPDPGDMDGDFDTGMASAGWGTDEDYGYFGE